MRVDRELITVERLKEFLRYEPRTGRFVWLRNRKSCMGKAKIGVEAGSPHAGGYVSIRIDGRAYLAHRLAWFYVHGQWPVFQIDHRDGDKRNNRIANLRDVVNVDNVQNQRKAQSRSRTGILGVIAVGRRYRAQIGVNGRNKYIGVFDTPEEAHSAYVAEKRALHAGCTI